MSFEMERNNKQDESLIREVSQRGLFQKCF